MPQEIVPTGGDTALAVLGQVADAYAQQTVFAEYLSRRSDNTLRAQLADLNTYSLFLGEAGLQDAPSGEQLQTDAEAWQGMSHGLVKAFRNWMIQRGDAVSSVNRRLSTVRKYASLAFEAGAIDETTQALIKAVQGYSGVDARRIDERRPVTRTGHKKAAHVTISDEHAKALKSHPDTPQGRRDALLMCLLLDHGLRVGEVALLTVSSFDLKAGELRFYRPKVDREQAHKLTADTLRAVGSWIDAGDCPPFEAAPILRGSRKGGALTAAGMTERSISQRVRSLAREIGVENLSGHDCRHYWATHWAGRVDVFRLQEAGGWSSLAMPRRYTEWAEIANEGMA